jgi:hypothetical protein
MSMQPDIERLQREIRYLRNCIQEAFNALPTLPGTSLDNWCVSSPICRAIRPYKEIYDEEFEPKVVSKKRKKVSQYLTAEILPGEQTGERKRLRVDELPPLPEEAPKVGKQATKVMNSLGIEIHID